MDGDFSLDGRTLLFEVLGTDPGLEHDQLLVDGIADLNEGNVVFAFINDFKPGVDVFDLIIADQILVNLDRVSFYYGLFDASYSLHAPISLGLYNILDYKDSNAADDVLLYQSGGATGTRNPGDSRLVFDDLLSIQYADQGGAKIQAADVELIPLSIPEPASLLLLAPGLMLLGGSRRRSARLR